MLLGESFQSKVKLVLGKKKILDTNPRKRPDKTIVSDDIGEKEYIFFTNFLSLKRILKNDVPLLIEYLFLKFTLK